MTAHVSNAQAPVGIRLVAMDRVPGKPLAVPLIPALPFDLQVGDAGVRDGVQREDQIGMQDRVVGGDCQCAPVAIGRFVRAAKVEQRIGTRVWSSTSITTRSCAARAVRHPGYRMVNPSPD